MAGPFPSYKVRFQMSSFGSIVYSKANLWWLLASLVLVLVLGLDFVWFLLFFFIQRRTNCSFSLLLVWRPQSGQKNRTETVTLSIRAI